MSTASCLCKSMVIFAGSVRSRSVLVVVCKDEPSSARLILSSTFRGLRGLRSHRVALEATSSRVTCLYRFSRVRRVQIRSSLLSRESQPPRPHRARAQHQTRSHVRTGKVRSNRSSTLQYQCRNYNQCRVYGCISTAPVAK